MSDSSPHYIHPHLISSTISYISRQLTLQHLKHPLHFQQFPYARLIQIHEIPSVFFRSSVPYLNDAYRIPFSLRPRKTRFSTSESLSFSTCNSDAHAQTPSNSWLKFISSNRTHCTGLCRYSLAYLQISSEPSTETTSNLWPRKYLLSRPLPHPRSRIFPPRRKYFSNI